MNKSVDKDCLQAFNNGEEWAFDKVYRAYYAMLVHYSHRMLHSRSASESVVQGVFLKLWEQRGNRSAILSLESYLLKAVYHASLNSVEHQRIRQGINTPEAREFYDTHIVQSPEAEQRMSDSAVAGAVEEAIGELPERCREIFRLSKIEGLKNREIAARLNLSEKTVEAQMTIALRKLREKLRWLLTIFLFFLGVFSFSAVYIVDSHRDHPVSPFINLEQTE